VRRGEQTTGAVDKLKAEPPGISMVSPRFVVGKRSRGGCSISCMKRALYCTNVDKYSLNCSIKSFDRFTPLQSRSVGCRMVKKTSVDRGVLVLCQCVYYVECGQIQLGWMQEGANRIIDRLGRVPVSSHPMVSGRTVAEIWRCGLCSVRGDVVGTASFEVIQKLFSCAFHVRIMSICC
jgi:hypothetical protein